MSSTIKTRRTHYEVLGLEPSATGDEIERAFAGAISIFQPHGFGGVAEASVAFRTLRDPERRRAYDASLGLKPKPVPRPAPMTWRVGAQFLAASGTPVLPRARPEELVEPSAEPEPTPFIAAALRELARPEPLVDRSPPPAPPADVHPAPRAEPIPDAGPTAGGRARADLALAETPGDAEANSVPWKPIGIAAGALILVVASIGGWAGWNEGSATEPAENEAKVALPPPTTFTVGDPATAAATQAKVLDDVRPLPTRPRPHPATRVARSRPTSRLADLDRQLAAPPEPSPPQSNPTEQAATIASPTTATASLPLPNRVIARTIERIGYPCGQVASTAQSGASGAFRVTCTSGHSYQAAPVRGRYHFRRLGGG